MQAGRRCAAPVAHGAACESGAWSGPCKRRTGLAARGESENGPALAENLENVLLETRPTEVRLGTDWKLDEEEMGKFGVLFLFLMLQISKGCASDVHVTGCDACHAEATCLKLEESGDTSSTTTTLSCLCKDGFVGDGINCYEVKECGADSSCCSTGFKWSPKQGCVDVDECSLTPSPCGASQLCQNTQGSFECVKSPAFRTRRASLFVQAVQFGCGGITCPHGMDCITLNGTSRCADPCENYSPLDDPWRATDNPYTGQPKCDNDVNWQGWYRLFLYGSSAQIPESCVEQLMCGTHAPMYITEPHPTQSNYIERRHVCATFHSRCCYFDPPSIHVKRCYGHYYVYRLVRPNGCSFAYCAGSLNLNFTYCVHHEDASAVCELRDPEIQVYQLICGQDQIQVTLNRATVSSSGLDPLSGHLVDRNCSRSRVQNNTVWYEVEPRVGVCGNTRSTNQTHVIYTNSLFLYGHNNSFHVPASLPFSCVYPLEIDARLNAALRPLVPTGGIVASGEAPRALMSLYRDSSFSSTYPSGSVSLQEGQPLYVGVYVEENDINFVTVLDDCYVTYTSNPNDPMRQPLIQNKCSSDPRQVSVVESGTSLRARFSALFFVPQGQYRMVYLHCQLNLCNPGPCVPVCSGRARRSVSEGVAMQPLSIGPITWGTN
ncbi:LOW QUALITY PROTEIN: pancreatic secretory granule membrane major glycoprotein GP2-like [Eucyclogobius newberryi]|uniref:LOW QUALITY PROTEIN: pancreatic secretory granule membrane major glycoprotein GP2-like n=1 Tax=Eucyclogobius newberryi TaxID=166745 RepID=UPI003B58C6E6